jgi:flagellar export protein FliJ
MRGLPSLIKMRGLQLDEKRRKLAELERMRAALIERREAIDAEIAKEKASAEAKPETQADFGAFLQGALKRRATLERSIADVERESEAANDEVAEAYRELKKFELVKQREDADALLEGNRREQAQLDEIGLNNFLRRGRE